MYLVILRGKNYIFKMESNLGLHLSKGCYGIAENYMHWPKEMIVSGLTTDLIGHRYQLFKLKVYFVVLFWI